MLHSKIKLNTFHLKLIAVVFMLIDHIGHFLIPTSEPTYLYLRILGRIAAPLFWYCFAVGFKHSSDRTRYIERLWWSAAIMALGNFLTSKIFDCSLPMLQPNIFLTMCLMSMAITTIETGINKNNRRTTVLYYGMAALLCTVVGLWTEYGWYAVGSILLLYFCKSKWKCLAFALFTLFICWLDSNIVQVFMILSVPFMLLDGEKKPKCSWKWFFYIFYPVHIWILAIIAIIL